MNLTIFPEKLPLSYVSRYIFGLGFAVAIPCIVLAFSLGWWTSSWESVKRALWGTGPEPTGDHQDLAKDRTLKSPAQAEPAQDVHRSSDASSTILQNNEGRPSPSSGELPTIGTLNVTTGLKRRWRKWRNVKKTDLPR